GGRRIGARRARSPAQRTRLAGVATRVRRLVPARLRRRRVTARSWPLLVACSLGAACAADRPPPQPLFAELPRGSPLHFQYVLADGRGFLTPEPLRGRPTVLVFLTTYDLASQVQARFLSG